MSEGLQSALWQLGGVPKAHRTDRLSTVVNRVDSPDEFTQRYWVLLKHFEITIAEKFQAMMKLGLLNKRMKDFHDIWLLAPQQKNAAMSPPHRMHLVKNFSVPCDQILLNRLRSFSKYPPNKPFPFLSPSGYHLREVENACKLLEILPGGSRPL